MYFHVVLTVELLAAFRTRVQFLAVHVTMGGQVARLRETRAALRTHVFPQTLVLQQVLVEKRLGRVAIVADLAHERLRIRMLQHVRLVLGSDFERFAALFARVRGRVASFDVLVQHRQTGIEIVTKTATEIASLLHVNACHVTEQPRAMWEDLAAILAGQILRRLMRLHVNLQRDLMVIALSAIRTDVRSQTFVNIVVLGQIELRLESFRTLGTLYGPRIGVRTSNVLHYVGLANELGVANNTRVLFDAQVCLHVYRALIPAFVELAAYFTRVTVLIVVHYMLHIVIHLDFLSVNPEELFGILRGLQPLLQFCQILQLRRRVAVLYRCVVDNAVDDAVHFHAVLVRQQIDDRRVYLAVTLIGKNSRAHRRHLVVLFLAQLYGEAVVLGVVVSTFRFLHGDLNVGRVGNDLHQLVQSRSRQLNRHRVLFRILLVRSFIVIIAITASIHRMSVVCVCFYVIVTPQSVRDRCLFFARCQRRQRLDALFASQPAS